MASSGLGPFCTAAGLTADLLSSNGPFPALARNKITNGLVIELLRYTRIRRLQDTYVASWLISLGLQDCQDLLTASINCLDKKRDELRRKRRNAEIHILEYRVFEPENFPATSTEHVIATVQPATSTAPPQQSCHVPLEEIVKDSNALTHEINKKRKELDVITSSVKEAKEKLQNIKCKIGHFKPANTTKRDNRAKEVKTERDHLQIFNQRLEKELAVLKENVATLEKEKLKLKNSKAYFIKKYQEGQEECTACKNLMEENKKQSRVIAQLTLEVEELHEERRRVKTKEKGKFNTDMRACVMELTGLEVATAKVRPVIQAVAKHLFQYEFLDSELPNRTTCQEIADQGQMIARQYMGKRIHESAALGVHKDGTTRKRRKIIDATDSGEAFSLGFNTVASETGQAITDNIIVSLKEVLEDSPASLKETAGKIKYTMSDRAANEKKSNHLLAEWQKDILEANHSTIQDFFCMAHVLLGFQSECLKVLKPVQRKLAPDGKMGRDRHKGFKCYKSDQATSRMCAAVSSAFGPVGEHFGVRDRWEAHCATENIHSTVQNFKDNRFNGLFCLAASTCHHRKQFQDVLALVEDPNKKLAALIKDLEDDDLLTIMRGLGIMYIKVTNPFWVMISSPSTTYLQLGPTIKTLLKEMEEATRKPEKLLLPNAVESLSAYRASSTPFDAIIPKCLTPPLWLVITEVAQAFVVTIKRQLNDFLEHQATEEAIGATKFAPANNLVCERNFGHLDSSQQRRPSASFFHHNTVHALKQHRKSIVSWLDSMSQEERSVLWKGATAKAHRSRRQHQANNRKELLKTLQRKKKQSVASRLIKKAKSTKRKASALEEKLKRLETAEVTVNQWIIVAYSDNWYPGVVTRLINDNLFEVNFCERIGRRNDFKWPEGKDIQVVERKFLLSADADVFTKTGRTWAIRDAKDFDLLFKSFASHFF